MNKKIILEATTTDKKIEREKQIEKQKQKQKEYKAGYIASCVGFGLTTIVWIVVAVLNAYFHVEIPLLGTSLYVLLSGIAFAMSLSLSIICKKARALYIVLASILGIVFTYCLGYFVGSVIGML